MGAYDGLRLQSTSRMGVWTEYCTVRAGPFCLPLPHQYSPETQAEMQELWGMYMESNPRLSAFRARQPRPPPPPSTVAWMRDAVGVTKDGTVVALGEYDMLGRFDAPGIPGGTFHTATEHQHGRAPCARRRGIVAHRACHALLQSRRLWPRFDDAFPETSYGLLRGVDYALRPNFGQFFAWERLADWDHVSEPVPGSTAAQRTVAMWTAYKEAAV